MDSVRSQLIVLVLACTVPVLVFALVMLFRYGQAQQAATHAQMLTTSRALALAVSRELKSAQTALSVLARSPMLEQKDLAGFHKISAQAAADFGSDVWFVLFDWDTQLVNTHFPFGHKLPATPPRAQQMLDGKEPVVSGALRVPSTGTWAVTVGIPVRTINSAAPHYGLAIVMPLHRFSQLLEEQKLPDGWLSSIVDRNGTIVARSINADRFVSTPAVPDYLEKIGTRDEGIVETVSSERWPVYAGFSRVPAANWTVAIAARTQTVWMPTVRSILSSALGGSVLVGVGLLTALLVSRRITEPIGDLVQAARTVGQDEVIRLGRSRLLSETREVGEVLQASGLRVTEALRAEQHANRQLRQLADTLEQRVAERTEQLARANQAKSEFLAHISHEIRTPLTGVLGLSDLMATEPLPEAQRERLALLRSSAKSLTQLLGDVLDFAKIEAGKLTIEKVPFEPRAIVTEVVGLFESAARAKEVAISLHCDHLPSRCLGDPVRLRQVLTNLIGNAVKFTDQGSVEVRAWASDAGSRLHFSVQDTGVGLPLQGRNRLFEAFTQADASITRRYGGSGLGLAICKRLVDAMGGSVGATSAPGGGSLFEFDVRVLTAQCIDPNGSEAEQLCALFHAGISAKVLLVEDDSVNRTMIESMLIRMGHAVDAVADGHHALAALDLEGYDLVVTDLRMPDMDGATLAKRIRALPAPHASMPIIAVSADVTELTRMASLGVFDGVATKPIDWQHLHDLMQAQLACVLDADTPRGAQPM